LVGLGYRSNFDGEGISEAAGAARRIPGEYAYRNEASRAPIELHSEATLRYLPRRLDLEAILTRRETIAAGGEVRTFSAEDELVLLSVHGASHFWDHLGWIADNAALARSPEGPDWE
jgi:hypothetical protein